MKRILSRKYANVHYVYAHIDPRTAETVYIGKGTKDRAWCFSSRSPKHDKWIKELVELGLQPIVALLFENDSSEDAYRKEAEFIDSNLSSLLFNRISGGFGKPPNIIPWNKSKKTGQIPWNKGIKTGPVPGISEPTRLRMTGNTLRKNKKMSDSAKAKISDSLVGNQRRSEAIICLNSGKRYPSIKSAWQELGLDERAIFRVLKGEWKHTKGYRFQYV